MKIHTNRKKIKRIFLVVSAIGALLFPDMKVLADDCSIKIGSSGGSVDLNQMANCFEKRYGYDKDSLRRSKQKESAPEVSLFFDKTSPKEGEKVTATAVPKSFRSSNEQLYYTWYILHDQNQDGNVDNTIEAGKEEAMGRVARGSFDPVLFGVSADKYRSDADSDQDGFLAPFGGRNGVGAKGLSTNGNGSTDDDKDGVDNTRDNCQSDYNPQQTDLDNDGKGDACDSDRDNDDHSSSEDNCPLAYNKDQKDSDGDGLGDACDPTPETTPFNDNLDEYVTDEDSDNDGVPDGQDNCYGKANSNQDDEDADGIGDSCDDKNNVQSAGSCSVGNYEKPDETGVVKTNCITRCYRHNFGMQGYAGADGSFSQEADADPDSGKDKIISCQHEFARASGSGQLNVAGGSLDLSCSGFQVGDGEFSDQEESCWKLDPGNPDTDGDGVKDEEDVVGLNQQQFTWNYQKGDRVGVVVEGTSMIPTNEENLNAYYKIMWATPGICAAKDVSKADGDLCEGSSDYGFNFLDTKAIDEYTESNFEVALQSNPQDPQYDILDQSSSDQITVSAAITNEAVDVQKTYFKWDIYRCTGPNATDCVTENVFNEDSFDPERDNLHLTANCQVGTQQPVGECGINLGTQLEGLGLEKITFTPRKEIMEQGLSREYFKVVVRTSRQKIDDSFKRYSIADVLVPVTQSDMGIKFFAVTKKEDGTYSLGEEICTQGLYRKICPVYPYQIIGAKAISYINQKAPEKFNIASYSWKLNGSALQVPLVCPFESCGVGNVAFFPVYGTKLAIGNIAVTAQRRDSGEALVSQRMFSLNDPLAKIYTNDASVAWPFIKFDGTEAPNVFETYPGEKVSFRADLVPDYLTDQDVQLTWLINNTEVTEEFLQKNPNVGITLDGNNISFIVDGSVGSSVRLAARVKKDFDAGHKQLLSSAWGVESSQNLISESGADIKIVFRPQSSTTEAETASVKLFLASTITNAPHYLLFTLRLAIGMILVLAVLIGLSYVVKGEK